MDDPVLWQLGFIVVQEAVIMTIVLMTGYLILRGCLKALDRAGRQRRAFIVPAAAATVRAKEPAQAEELVVAHT